MWKNICRFIRSFQDIKKNKESKVAQKKKKKDHSKSCGLLNGESGNKSSTSWMPRIREELNVSLVY